MSLPPLSQFHGLIGIVTIIGLCVLMSNNRRRIDWRLVISGLALQFAFAATVILTSPGQAFFAACDRSINRLLDFSREGTSFLLKSFVTQSVEPAVQNLAFVALPSLIFFSAMLSLLYYLGIMQWVVRILAWVMVRTMGTSGAETLSVAGDVFVGQTEAPLLIRPYLEKMTRSELNTVMCGGFSTIAGTVMGLYVSWLQDHIPGVAGHLLAASVMSAPAAILISKIMVPEVDLPLTRGTLQIKSERTASNVIEAIGDGATDGMDAGGLLV